MVKTYPWVRSNLKIKIVRLCHLSKELIHDNHPKCPNEGVTWTLEMSPLKNLRKRKRKRGKLLYKDLIIII